MYFQITEEQFWVTYDENGVVQDFSLQAGPGTTVTEASLLLSKPIFSPEKIRNSSTFSQQTTLPTHNKNRKHRQEQSDFRTTPGFIANPSFAASRL